MKTIKLNLLGIGILSLFFLFALNASAQSSSYVGNWQSTAPVPSMNNAIVKIKILSTSDPNVLIIVNFDNPKKKFVAKYDASTNRIYAIIRNQNLYFNYVAASDTIDCYNVSNNNLVCSMVRF